MRLLPTALSPVLAALTGCGTGHPAVPPAGACDTGLTLPAGFCAQVFADGLGALRHIAVGPTGDVYVARWNSEGKPGGVVALRDTTNDGRADILTVTDNAGGSGLALAADAVYMATWTEVLRYRLRPGVLRPDGNADTVLLGLTRSGHGARSLVLANSTDLLVNVGAPTNSCQANDKEPSSPGRDPCPERELFAGVWRIDARRLRQRQVDGRRIVSGVRHLVAITRHPSGDIYAVQHGRDDLSQSFPELYDRAAGETLPAEELFRLEDGKDYGWPYCYYDAQKRRKVLAPEYGGDGSRVGKCASAELPLYAFPAHWAPNALHFYQGAMFPARYRGGAFVAFHGGWYRGPPHNGFNIAFLPFERDRPATRHEIFADGFAGADRHPARARHRPVGLAEGPDGALFITDDVGGRIWRVIYRGQTR